MPVSPPRTADPAEAAAHLARVDPVLRRIIRRLGVQPLPKDRGGFPSLARAIIFQQISGAAGASIHRRVRSAHGGRGFPPPAWFVSAATETLAQAGLSPQKRGYLVDLARHTHSGRLEFARLRRLPDDQVIEALTMVKGVGTWTAQMYLLFSLNRPDVLATGDLGIRKAVGRAYGFKSLPSERTVERIGRPWAPYRSFASYYLWRSLDTRLPTPRTGSTKAARGAAA
jgi:DNA-3-methyladenine glycosylase II